MFNIFGSSSPFDSDVEKATSENNTSEQWDVIIDICDRAGSNSKNAKDCLRSIMKRMGHMDPHVAMQAITLLDACIKNCGKTFHLEIASREFETEFQRLMQKASVPVAQKMRSSLKKWAENEFKSDHQLNLIPSLFAKLKSDGIDFSDNSSQSETVKPQYVVPKDPNIVTSQQEEDDIAKAIQLSMAEVKMTDTKESLYPSMNLGTGTSPKQVKSRKVRALYDFEAAEDNELTFFSGEIIHVLDDTDSNWWSGFNDRGEGLFPSNFVTADLNAEVETEKVVASAVSIEKDEHKPEIIHIDELKIDRLLNILHEANPEDPSQDPPEMFFLEAQVNQMLPLIDAELEIVDRNHAKLTQLSTNLVEAINMYHHLMNEGIPSHMYRQMPSHIPMPGGGQISNPGHQMAFNQFPQHMQYLPQQYANLDTQQNVMQNIHHPISPFQHPSMVQPPQPHYLPHTVMTSQVQDQSHVYSTPATSHHHQQSQPQQQHIPTNSMEGNLPLQSNIPTIYHQR